MKKKKPRARITAAIKHRIYDESDSACVQCRSTKSSSLQFHHIDGDRSKSSFENLILLCASCHTEFTSGTKNEADGLVLKRMAGANALPPRQGETKGINLGDNFGVVAQQVGTVNLRQSKGKTKPVIPGAIGADADMRAYADYLVKRYIEWRKKSDEGLRRIGKPPRAAFRPGAAHTILGKDFGSTSSVNLISANRFQDWIVYTQSRIDGTFWGKRNRNRNYHSWEEHLTKRHG